MAANFAANLGDRPYMMRRPPAMLAGFRCPPAQLLMTAANSMRWMHRARKAKSQVAPCGKRTARLAIAFDGPVRLPPCRPVFAMSEPVRRAKRTNAHYGRRDPVGCDR